MDGRINIKDFSKWHPRQEMAGYSSIHLWVELDFEEESYTYVITAPNIEDNRYNELDNAIRMYNKLVNERS